MKSKAHLMKKASRGFLNFYTTSLCLCLCLSLCAKPKNGRNYRNLQQMMKKSKQWVFDLETTFSPLEFFLTGAKNYRILLQQLKESVKKEYNNIA
jgi:hypothetical protein